MCGTVAALSDFGIGGLAKAGVIDVLIGVDGPEGQRARHGIVVAAARRGRQILRVVIHGDRRSQRQRGGGGGDGERHILVIRAIARIAFEHGAFRHREFGIVVDDGSRDLAGCQACSRGIGRIDKGRPVAPDRFTKNCSVGDSCARSPMTGTENVWLTCPAGIVTVPLVVA